MLIRDQRHECSHIRKRLKAMILIGAEHRDHRVPCGDQLCQKLRAHALAIDDDTNDELAARRLLVPIHDLREPAGQMQITAMGRDQQGMALSIMQ